MGKEKTGGIGMRIQKSVEWWYQVSDGKMRWNIRVEMKEKALET